MGLVEGVKLTVGVPVGLTVPVGVVDGVNPGVRVGVVLKDLVGVGVGVPVLVGRAQGALAGLGRPGQQPTDTRAKLLQIWPKGVVCMPDTRGLLPPLLAVTVKYVALHSPPLQNVPPYCSHAG